MAEYSVIKKDTEQFRGMSFPKQTVVNWAMQKEYELDLVYRAMYECDVKITPTDANEFFLYCVYMELRKLNNRDIKDVM